jgi:hypothetical protein
VEVAFTAAIKAVEKRSGRTMLLIFRNSALATADAADIKPDWLVGTQPHLLVLPAVNKAASKHNKQLTSTAFDWPGGDTSLGNELWGMLMERLELVDKYMADLAEA